MLLTRRIPKLAGISSKPYSRSPFCAWTLHRGPGMSPLAGPSLRGTDASAARSQQRESWFCLMLAPGWLSPHSPETLPEQ